MKILHLILINMDGKEHKHKPPLQARTWYIAADLLSIVNDTAGVPSVAIKMVSFYHKTSLIWHNLRSFYLDSICFERATDLVSKLDVASISGTRDRKLLLDLNLAGSRTAWEVRILNLAVALLNRSRTLLFGSYEHHIELAKQCMAFGKHALSKKNEVESNGSGDNGFLAKALKLMNKALEVSEKGA